MKDSHKDLILQKITGLDKEQLFLKYKNPPIALRALSPQGRKEYDECVSRLESGEPIEYIVERSEFYGLDFFVDSRVLVPRNDTEIMVDCVLEISPHSISPKGREVGKAILIDVGTGSGCIAIAVLKSAIIPPPSGTPFGKGRNLECYALDISEKALEVAEINIQNHGLESKIKTINSDLLEYFLNPSPSGDFPFKREEKHNIVITANLPYIKQDDFENMDQGVYVNEPDLALYGGAETGFELYKKLIGQCQELSKSGNTITLFIEIGFDQKEVCEDYLSPQGLKYEIFKDKGGVERCVRVEIK